MAIPPEPIQEVLPRASLIVVAEVTKVVSSGPEPPKVNKPEGWTSTGQKVASQVVVLKVQRVLKGELDAAAKKSMELTVTKPEAEYALRETNKGAFLLERKGSEWQIIGRYGPDSYRVEYIEKALKEAH